LYLIKCICYNLLFIIVYIINPINYVDLKMTTAGVESNISNDIKLLQRQSLKVEFHLDHTDYKRVENIGTG